MTVRTLPIRYMAALAALVALPTSALADVISGPAIALDGAGLRLGETVVQLWGIDAPGRGQTCRRDGAEWACGAEAARLVAALVATGEAECTMRGTDAQGRKLASCMIEGTDLAERLVTAGFALALPESAATYGEAQQRAKALRSGLWTGTFDPPSAWRRAHPAPVTRPVPPTRIALRAVPERRYVNAMGCAIKGNHSWRGEWIYHLPGTLHYTETRPEALFCTEEQALAAGYRRARND